jgi:hypothetical protein
VIRRTGGLVIDPSADQAHPCLGFTHGNHHPLNRMNALY